MQYVDLMSGGRKSRLSLFRREREKMKNGKETEAELGGLRVCFAYLRQICCLVNDRGRL